MCAVVVEVCIEAVLARVVVVVVFKNYLFIN